MNFGLISLKYKLPSTAKLSFGRVVETWLVWKTHREVIKRNVSNKAFEGLILNNNLF